MLEAKQVLITGLDSPWDPRTHKIHKGHTVSSKDDVADRNDLLEMINGETVNMPNA